MSFVRLVGTSYFKKHLAAFISSFSLETPVQLYNSIESSSTKPTERHKLWLEKIRNTVSNRIVNEEERVPTYTALWRHWLRSCWVSKMWQNSPIPDILYNLPRPEDSGWIRTSEKKFSVDWEAPEVQKKIAATIEFLTKGCNCKKGCKSKNCGCRKKRHTAALRVNAMNAATYLWKYMKMRMIALMRKQPVTSNPQIQMILPMKVWRWK